MDNVVCVTHEIWRQIRDDVAATKRIVDHGIDQAKKTASRASDPHPSVAHVSGKENRSKFRDVALAK